MATPDSTPPPDLGKIPFTSSDAHAGPLALGVVLALIPSAGKTRHPLVSRQSAARLIFALTIAALQTGGPTDA